MNIPQQITSGDSVTWSDSAALDAAGNTISSPEWSLVYTLRGPTALTLNATASGGGWTTTMTTAQSATLSPGTYYWQASASRGADRVTLASGSVSIVANLAYTVNPAIFDGRTQAQKDLEAVRAAMRAVISGGATQEYSIGNRSLKKMPMSDLIALESKLKADVVLEQRRKRIAEGLDSGRSTYIRFGR